MKRSIKLTRTKLKIYSIVFNNVDMHVPFHCVVKETMGGWTFLYPVYSSFPTFCLQVHIRALGQQQGDKTSDNNSFINQIGKCSKPSYRIQGCLVIRPVHTLKDHLRPGLLATGRSPRFLTYTKTIQCQQTGTLPSWKCRA